MSNHQIGLSGIESEEEVTLGGKNDLSKILEKSVPQRHSFFQLRYFVIGKEPTNQSKMWQCLKEIKARKDSLDSLDLEIEEQKDTLELLEIEEKMLNLGSFKDNNEAMESLKQEENKIKRRIKSINSNIAQLLSRKKYIEEELNFFVEMFKSLEKVEPLKDLDDVESQKDYWSEKLAQKLNLKMLVGGQLESELVETIIALPDDMKIKKQILNTLTVRHEQIVKKLEENKGRLNGN